MSVATVDDAWEKRVGETMRQFEADLRYYNSGRILARNWTRRLGLVIMIGSIVAPVAIASGPFTAVTIFSRDVTGVLNATPVILTLLVAIADGLRRMFQFQQRWTSSWFTYQSLILARDNYQDSIIGKAIGSEEWVEEYKRFKKAINEAKSKERDQFFAGVVANDVSVDQKKITKAPD